MLHRRSNLTVLGVACVGAFYASAAGAAQLKIYSNNGTGFFVHPSGYLVTNEHVVSYCKRLTVAGAMGVIPAKIIARDKTNDLALLKIDARNMPVGRFSTFKTPMEKGDRAVIVGFAGADTDAVTRDTQVMSTKGPSGEDKFIQLGDVLERGNSGGPLFDTSGNIIGVITAKAVLHTVNKVTREKLSTEYFGVAIAVPVVEAFLARNHIRAQMADTDIYLPTGHIASNARAFVVKVQCEYKTEVRH
jgi:S1-C subfamily serine protease